MRVEVEFYRSEDAAVECSCHGSKPKAGMLNLVKPNGDSYGMFEVCDDTLDVLETMELLEENAVKAR